MRSTIHPIRKYGPQSLQLEERGSVQTTSPTPSPPADASSVNENKVENKEKSTTPALNQMDHARNFVRKTKVASLT